MAINPEEFKKWCTARHPSMPNKSGNARGRKLHRSNDGKTTICNMITEKIGDREKMHFYSNGRCKICFNGIKI